MASAFASARARRAPWGRRADGFLVDVRGNDLVETPISVRMARRVEDLLPSTTWRPARSRAAATASSAECAPVAAATRARRRVATFGGFDGGGKGRAEARRGGGGGGGGDERGRCARDEASQREDGRARRLRPRRGPRRRRIRTSRWSKRGGANRSAVCQLLRSCGVHITSRAESR